jgi:hypothetical protein
VIAHTPALRPALPLPPPVQLLTWLLTRLFLLLLLLLLCRLPLLLSWYTLFVLIA